MFADAETAAIKSNIAFRISGFVGDKHLGIAVGALHMGNPWSGSTQYND